MITGTIMMDFEVECDNEAQLNDITAQIKSVAQTVKGVTDAVFVDQDTVDSSDADIDPEAE